MERTMSQQQQQQQQQDDDVYRCLVIDSGPIIRRTVTSQLWKRAESFYTVPAVLQEIRDAKARQLLENLPFELITREASSEGIQAVTEFSRLTGDFASLSSTDLAVLGLLYDLEREGCPDMSHVRTNPKRMVGLGAIQSLGGQEERKETLEKEDVDQESDEEEDGLDGASNDQDGFEQADGDDPSSTSVASTKCASSKPTTWAALLGGSTSMGSAPTEGPQSSFADQAVHVWFGKMNLTSAGDVGGQFSDAEEDASSEVPREEVVNEEYDTEQELKSDFPSLAASLTVPYEGSDSEEERKKSSLQPISKSGKLYNSFKKYGDVMKSKPAGKAKNATPSRDDESIPVKSNAAEKEETAVEGAKRNESRIIGGGMYVGGQDDDVEDDGEGWITSSVDIQTMKAAGALDPMRNPEHADPSSAVAQTGPPTSQRAACTTTDFAMQNVILQMNLSLLSVDGIKVRKLKNWVMRCGACYKVYTNADSSIGPAGRRLFCERCGSDMIQRIAASVDGKTGRLRLHLSKKYKHNLRGTKYSLPKPGSGDRFQGDLLLREDQLLMGAWQQKVKMRSGGKAKSAAQSMFGRDIASNVGCHSNAMTADDIRVGFGRRNPNASKGRERRGKKKKSSDKACGLRRY
jgi:RNA-binding protein NOB1